MKKLLCVLLVVLTMATMLAACGKFDCALCGKSKFGKSYEFMGAETCKDCNNDLKDLANSLK